MLLLEVEDNGSEIEVENIPELFDNFYRINPGIEGSGLGLYIVKRRVENRGGRIEVSSRVDEGSLFSVYLIPEKISLHKELDKTHQRHQLYRARKMLYREFNPDLLRISGFNLKAL